MEFIMIFCNINDLESAKVISRVLVGEKLAACVNIVPKISSVYFWDEKIVEDEEFLMLIKTRKSLFEEVKSMILEMHPYEVPEVISINIEEGSKDYFNWISDSTKIE